MKNDPHAPRFARFAAPRGAAFSSWGSPAMKKARSMALLAALISAVPLMAAAQVSVNIQVPGLVGVAPPPPRFERMPGPRPGPIWVPGRWPWAGNAYAWRGGYWQAARPDYDYVPGRWVRADGGWRWMEGDWRRGAYERRERYERRYDDDQGDRHHRHGGWDNGPGYHCPPGQAKKGNC
jgi:hypothetical protein